MSDRSTWTDERWDAYFEGRRDEAGVERPWWVKVGPDPTPTPEPKKRWWRRWSH